MLQSWILGGSTKISLVLCLLLSRWVSSINYALGTILHGGDYEGSFLALTDSNHLLKVYLNSCNRDENLLLCSRAFPHYGRYEFLLHLASCLSSSSFLTMPALSIHNYSAWYTSLDFSCSWKHRIHCVYSVPPCKNATIFWDIDRE